MQTRRLRILSDNDITKIANIYHSWRSKNPSVSYEDVPGFVKAASIDEISKHDFVLTPGRYVGTPEAEADGEPIDEKIERLKKELFAEFEEGRRLEEVIRERLGGLIYE